MNSGGVAYRCAPNSDQFETTGDLTAPKLALAQTLEQPSHAQAQSGARQSASFNLKRWVREPLLHFMLLGLALFGITGYTNRGYRGVELSKQIALTTDDLRQMVLTFAAQWERLPNPQELQGLVEEKVREEVLYREGIAMGLDKDDTIVKRRMAQKMQFLAEDVAGAHEPSTAELKAWFEKNSEKFALPGRYSFRHLYFSPDRRGKNAQQDAAMRLTEIAGLQEDSKRDVLLGDAFMFQDYYSDRTPEQLAKEFGPRFAVAIEETKPGSWQGPIESGYGWHLVFVDSVIPGRVPALEEVEADVKSAWLADQKQQAWKKSYAGMRRKYTVLLPAVQAPQLTNSASPQPAKQVSPALGVIPE